MKLVIIAGGSGTRLWPISRFALPKQFLNLSSDKTMLQDTIERTKGLDIDSISVICNEEHRFFVADQLKDIDILESIILEPVGKNTAPAIALSAMDAEEDLLLVLPSDHVIKNQAEFKETVKNATSAALNNKLVTFGIVPNEANTGYGYIKKGEEYDNGYEVDSFIEKPNLQNATEFIESGDYLWNSGMFLFKASIYLEELKKFRPEIYNSCKNAFKHKVKDSYFTRPDKAIFLSSPSESVDYAVMENTTKSIVVPLDADWSDLGSWNALLQNNEKDNNGNYLDGDIYVNNVSNSYIHSEKGFVSVLGLDDLILVSTKDAILVSSKEDLQNVKKITDFLKDNNREEWNFHREVHRPWGSYDSIDCVDGLYQVKKIIVKIGAKLSVQRHAHRAEHWVVVSGTAKVQKNEEYFTLVKDQSIYLPLGSIHSLENIGHEELVLIEVQIGDYLGEDDIERFEDIYGRS
ncbi:MAG: mannose-1-phosphate guanylyltransferase/mannose-6-phosphate isomerase [SAR86 cluster bacterium]|nr:mannose-1-phosphate guanylyltransferase/mannose-6-phosphate isomerase [SAR86 cluster bacterium]